MARRDAVSDQTHSWESHVRSLRYRADFKAATRRRCMRRMSVRRAAVSSVAAPDTDEPAFSWRATFLVAVPVMAVVAIGAPLLLPEHRDPNAGRLDPLSVVLLLAALLPFVSRERARGRDQPAHLSRGRRPGHPAIPRHRPGRGARPGRIAIHSDGHNDPRLPPGWAPTVRGVM